MKKTLFVSNFAALVITISINYLSNSGLLNGNTMGTVSDRYANYFTPAGYAFSIWGLIYLGLFGFAIYSWRSVKEEGRGLLEKIGWWFVLSCAANSLWVVAWLSERTGLSVLLMMVLLVSLMKIILNLGIGREAESMKDLLLVQWPFSIYFGWVSVALIANLAAFLTKIDWDGWGIAEVNWAIIMVCIAGLVNLVVIWVRKMRAFGLVGIWALLAIAFANGKSNVAEVMVNSCYVAAAVLAIAISVSMFKNRHLLANRR